MPPKENPGLADLVDYRSGLAMLREGRTDEAIQLLQRARTSSPRDPHVPNALGLALLYKKDYKNAVNAFSDALHLDSSFVEARNNRGVAHMEAGTLHRAEADFQAVLDGPPTPEKMNAHYNLGLLHPRREAWRDAEREFSSRSPIPRTTTARFPVNLDDPLLLANDGFDPSESDPRFHQQMVYAIATRTLQMFEVALGREIHWRRADRFGDAQDHTLAKAEDIRVLKLFPHAMQQANAYYSPQAHGILFGYFTAGKTNQGRNLPGQLVFTCLSQDIIAHEVTHAVIDGIRTYFMQPTNPDVLAFHEGFADLCALFSHFSQHDALIGTIQRTGGRLYQTELAAVAPGGSDAGKAGDSVTIAAQVRQMNPLIQLAIQFGQARGERYSLRSALGTPPNSDDIHRNINDPHFRGSILVAAVFDAFFSVYMGRADDLFRIYRASRPPHHGRGESGSARPDGRASRGLRERDGSPLLSTLRARDRLLPSGGRHVRRLPPGAHHGFERPRPGGYIRRPRRADGGVPAARHLFEERELLL